MARILIVDSIGGADERVAALVQALRTSGHSARIATGREEFEAYLATGCPDICVCAVICTDTSLREVIAALRLRYPREEYTVIAITAMMAEGEPWRDWSLPVALYVLGRDTWSLLLAIEAVLHRPRGAAQLR
jgi:DNA-binding response OmpR family regulator